MPSLAEAGERAEDGGDPFGLSRRHPLRQQSVDGCVDGASKVVQVVARTIHSSAPLIQVLARPRGVGAPPGPPIVDRQPIFGVVNRQQYGCAVHHLVGVAEIAEMFGVTRQRVNAIVKTSEDFPEPEAELSAGRIWLRSAIVAWADAHGRSIAKT